MAEALTVQSGRTLAAPGRATLVDPAERGTLVVADRVIERIATIAAMQVRGVVRTGSRWDQTVGRQLPRVESRTAGSRARLVVEMAVEWSVALGAVASDVRTSVADQLRALAAVDADAVDVVVVKIVPSTSVRRPS